jgi:Ribonuclease G/E
MAKQLIVSVNGREKKIAIIEDDKVSEFYIERGEQHQGIVGNIYKGRVMRVLPGMQSAFVDIGLERDAFLYVSDFFDEEEEFERIVIDKSKKGTPDAEHAAAEEVALNRVEREQRIEGHSGTRRAASGRGTAAPPRRSFGHTGIRRVADAVAGRRGRWEKATSRTRHSATKLNNSKYLTHLSSPAIHRSSESSTKKRLQPTARCSKTRAAGTALRSDSRRRVQHGRRLPHAEVGSILSSGFGSSRSNELTMATDGEADSRAGRPREAHVSSFIDDVEPETLSSPGFQRISDDEEEAGSRSRRKSQTR